MIYVRKLKVYCEDKDFYRFFNQEQREQNKALNLAMSYSFTNSILKSVGSGQEKLIIDSITKMKKDIEKYKIKIENPKIKDKKREELEKSIETLEKLIKDKKTTLEESKEFRIGTDKAFEEMYIKNIYHVLAKQTEIQYMRTIELVKMKVKNDFSNNFVDIVTGNQSLINYKKDFPLMIDKQQINLFEEDNKFKIKIMRGYELIIQLGKRSNENVDELKSILKKCINKTYTICQSSIQKDRNNNIIFNLTIDMPKSNNYEPIKDRTLGIDLGIAVPVYMTVNDNTYKKQALGNINDFLRVRQQMQERRHRLQKDLVLTKGGRGRDKKIQALTRLKEKEKNFVKTYNHTLSSRVIEFAKRMKVEYINMEKLVKDGFDESILRNWSYYELQNMIEYKAKRLGIKVRYVDPSFTSQMCSCCGHIDKNNRPKKDKGQSYFKCTKCGFELNADHNASINISRMKEGESLRDRL